MASDSAFTILFASGFAASLLQQGLHTCTNAAHMPLCCSVVHAHLYAVSRLISFHKFWIPTSETI
jgi:hypothetical protein